MACYRSGGCGPYENRSCNECPASRPEYATLQQERERAREIEAAVKKAREEFVKKHDSSEMQIKVFVDENGVMCAMSNTKQPIRLEVVNVPAVEKNEGSVDAYLNQLCGDGFTYIDNHSMTTHL